MTKFEYEEPNFESLARTSKLGLTIHIKFTDSSQEMVILCPYKLIFLHLVIS